MPKPGACSENNALFVSPEAPVAGSGGGGLRSASLLEYLRSKYQVQVAGFTLPHHSKSTAARVWRNGWRFVRGAPPLFDRYSGYEAQLQPFFNRHYAVGVIEHFWCASYMTALRPHCDRVVLDLHNIESELARTHALATGGLQGIAGKRFASAYAKLERKWIPEFDLVLVASEEDRRRIDHPSVHIFPNALPEVPRPNVAETDSIVFSGNLEYHPNVEAVRWFRNEVWPLVVSLGGAAGLAGCLGEHPAKWRLIGRNPEAVASIVAGDPNIDLIGPVDDAITEIARSKIAIVPLLSGSGTRFKILEAWAAARPVVSTAIGAEGLGARTGEHLLIADNASDFAAAIARLLEDPALRRSLGEAGRALYLDRFTWPAAWRALNRLL
jgi:glycosyltransferase involved in cell wall biosynthesis